MKVLIRSKRNFSYWLRSKKSVRFKDKFRFPPCMNFWLFFSRSCPNQDKIASWRRNVIDFVLFLVFQNYNTIIYSRLLSSLLYVNLGDQASFIMIFAVSNCLRWIFCHNGPPILKKCERWSWTASGLFSSDLCCIEWIG